jgi:hypothetical protein
LNVPCFRSCIEGRHFGGEGHSAEQIRTFLPPRQGTPSGPRFIMLHSQKWDVPPYPRRALVYI